MATRFDDREKRRKFFEDIDRLYALLGQMRNLPARYTTEDDEPLTAFTRDAPV